jgi:hypothetical protein
MLAPADFNMTQGVQPTNVGWVSRRDFLTSDRAAGTPRLTKGSAVPLTQPSLQYQTIQLQEMQYGTRDGADKEISPIATSRDDVQSGARTNAVLDIETSEPIIF